MLKNFLLFLFLKNKNYLLNNKKYNKKYNSIYTLPKINDFNFLHKQIINKSYFFRE
jgi:hypothetical protein